MKKLVSLTFILLLIIGLQSLTYTASVDEKIYSYYHTHLKSFDEKCTAFEKFIKEKKTKERLKKEFLQLRVAYKKFAFIPEYYNTYQNRLLNGPPLQWVEDDNPTILQPNGLQVIEELLYTQMETVAYDKLEQQISIMLRITKALLADQNSIKKFTPTLVFDALKQSIIRLMSMGITGFDSPLANHSLPEAVASLDALAQIISYYKTEANTEDFKVISLINNAIVYIKKQNNFNKLDRLFFIKNYINPIYNEVVALTVQNNWIADKDRNPINPLAQNIFDTTFFNINAFSPTPRYRPTVERTTLGKKLFYDNILSANNTISCATCHKPALAFTDGLLTPFAIDGETKLLRNTPTLYNAVYQTKFFYDSRIAVLENQIHDVVHNQNEMGGSLDEAVLKLKKDKSYKLLFDSAYKNDYEKITVYNISNALASYLRSITSVNSRFDKYMRNESTNLSSAEKNGFNLFMGKAKCATCHYAPLLNGLVPPAFAETESEIIGVPSLNSTKANPLLDEDLGKASFTKISIHNNAFKTPTLKNISKTAPYMHNGVFNTLQDVLTFYNNGGGTGLGITIPNQTLPSAKLGLTKKEIKDIISFLNTLDE